MADALTIDVSQLLKGAEKVKLMKQEVLTVVDNVLDANAIEISATAKRLAPVDIGGLRSSIAADNSKALEKHITVNAFYSAFIEFGTGAYAANYVSSLPASWQEFAMRFKGQKGGGTFADFVKNLEKWVKRNVTATYSIKTQRRTKTPDETKRTKQMAYLIARAIMKNGVKPQPFLFPAYEQQRTQIIRDVETVLKNL